MNDCEMQLPKDTLDGYKGSYLVDGMNAARKCLIEEVYKTRSKSKIELESKLKCGMLSPDVLDYFVHEKINSIDEKDYYGEEEDGEIEEFGDFEIKSVSEKDSESKINELPVERANEKIEDESNYVENSERSKPRLDKKNHLHHLMKTRNKNKLKSSKKSQLKMRLSHIPNMDHKCKKNCPENLNISVTNAKKSTDQELVFVCDVCTSRFHSPEMALFHINRFDHISASEFLTEKSSLLKSIVNRCSIKSSSKNQSVGVFCPNRKCSFYFKSGFCFINVFF